MKLFWRLWFAVGCLILASLVMCIICGYLVVPSALMAVAVLMQLLASWNECAG